MQSCIHCERQLSPGMTVCPNCGQNIPPLLETRSSNQTPITDQPTYMPAYMLTINMSGNLDNDIDTVCTLSTAKRTATVATALPAYKQALKKRKIFSYLIITVISILTLILLACVAGTFYYTKIAHPTQLHAQSTVTSQNMQRANSHNIAVANANATKSAVAQNKATAKASVHSTAQAQHSVAQVQATATSLQNLYTRSTSGPPALDTPLFFNSSAQWDIYPTKDGGGCAFSANALHSRAFQTNYYSPCIAHATSFQNFVLQIQMTIIKGDEGGIIFRSNSHDQDFYSFRMRNDGTYGLILTQNDGHTTPLIYDQSNLIKTGDGQTNTVTIIAQGNIFYLYMNKHYVGSASDSTYSTGSIGIMAVDRKNQTDVAFNNLRIWKL